MGGTGLYLASTPNDDEVSGPDSAGGIGDGAASGRILRASCTPTGMGMLGIASSMGADHPTVHFIAAVVGLLRPQRDDCAERLDIGLLSA
jgi:hypothetical protein